ncbi:MAG: SBBP repeat-containing protein [Nitrososphaeraceae archaeon]|nr:SBBP repeat-containing protein [Nitrososphaeraceae archaeon]
MKKIHQPIKKIASVVLPIILIVLIASLIIIYFLNQQIINIYQYDKSIGIIGYNQIFATSTNPTGIATDNKGNIYVLDDENDKVKKFTNNGTFVKEWDIQRTKMADLVLTGIATDNKGNIYVIDLGGGQVKKFTNNGTFVKEWNIN